MNTLAIDTTTTGHAESAGHAGTTDHGDLTVRPGPTDPVTDPAADRTTGGATAHRPVRMAARIAGWGYVALFALAIFANFTVVERLVVADDVAATTANIEASLGRFRLGLIAFLAIFLIDIVVAWALHQVFRERDHELSLFAAWSRLVYTVFLGVGLVYFFQVIDALAGPTAEVLDRQAIEARVFGSLQSFDAAWMIGLAAFGLHLVLIGALILRTRLAPRALGVVLIVAGLAYVVDTVATAVLADYESYAGLFLAMVAVPSMLGEGWFGLWLLLRAGRNDAPAPASAP